MKKGYSAPETNLILIDDKNTPVLKRKHIRFIKIIYVNY
jgi:hypothetical protein